MCSIPAYRQRRDEAARGARKRQALEQLGPSFVKLGQELATRPDRLPEDTAVEIARQQEDAPPLPGEQAIEKSEAAHGEPRDAHCAEYNRQPAAPAPEAQGHHAHHRDGSDVGVKELRPGTQAVTEREVEVPNGPAQRAERVRPESRRQRPVEVVNENKKTPHEERDWMREAAKASQ
jgi:Predicted unusual protein kinase